MLRTENVNARITDVSRDGKFLVYSSTGQDEDLWILPLEANSKPIPFLQTPAKEVLGQFSPDGRWMAYVSDELGSFQVYVQPIPATGAKYQISSGGGSYPRWRRDGKELFFITADGALMAVPVKPGGTTLEMGAPQSLFKNVSFALPQRAFGYQPSPDGKRFLAIVPVGDEGSSPPIQVFTNWQLSLNK